METKTIGLISRYIVKQITVKDFDLAHSASGTSIYWGSLKLKLWDGNSPY